MSSKALHPTQDSLISSRGVATPFDVAKVRRDFPILGQRIHGKPLVYLDNAATTQKPQAVIDAMVRSYAEDNANIHRGVHLLSERATRAYEEAREKVQKFLNAPDQREIIFVRGTTEAINLVAHSWGRQHVGPGDAKGTGSGHCITLRSTYAIVFDCGSGFYPTASHRRAAAIS